MATLTSEAKQLLSRSVRDLRERLLRDLHNEAERRYRLSIPPEKAKLTEDLRRKRERLDAWLDERARTANPKTKRDAEAARERFLRDAVKEAAATLLNRIVLLRHLEALGLQKPAVVTGGWNSKGYRELREFAPALLGDETEGYSALLQVVFDELALEMPGLFGDVGLTRLFAVPPATLREVVERLDDPGLEPAWADDTTLGWVYQYWNDPEREDLDKKLNDGGKIEPHEIASKTQMFTGRYMVEWLLHNSLGPTWLHICKKNGWTADAEAVLPVLAARRAEWRKRRKAGEIPLDALMPIEGELEEHWKYHVPQPIPDEAVASAPDSIRTLKLLDPACGSGHFLVIAFDLLAAMYREEARHRREIWSDREIAEAILENNLHGIDIDPRAVQIAAAAVVLKAKRLAKDARPKVVNLVAPLLRLGACREDDPALARLRREVREETGIPEELTNGIVTALAGVDQLGSLLKVDAALDEAIADHERGLAPGAQLEIGRHVGATPGERSAEQVRAALLEKVEQFLAHHASEEDLGLRLDGEQLAAGIRFVRLIREGSYDLVVGNPPYLATGSLLDAERVAKGYPDSKADLFAAFVERGLQLCRPGGATALVTMRSWMFLTQFREFRESLLSNQHVGLIGDLDIGAFEEIGGAVVSCAMSVIWRTKPGKRMSSALRAHGGTTDCGTGPLAKQAELLVQAERYDFNISRFRAVDGAPLVYWWDPGFLVQYAKTPKLGQAYPVRKGMITSNNSRFLRWWWEPRLPDVATSRDFASARSVSKTSKWVPYIKGAAGRAWFEDLSSVIEWSANGLTVKVLNEHLYGSYSRQIMNEACYFGPGVAFAKIGSSFRARAHRYPSVIDTAGSTVYADEVAAVLCLLNSALTRMVVESLNPTVNFTNADIERVPVVSPQECGRVFNVLELSFSVREAARESSVEFKHPSPHAWSYAQEWAQRSVDRASGEAVPEFCPAYEAPPAISFVSFSLGVALGRFGAKGEGILNEGPPTSLPGGILFLSEASKADSLDHPACSSLAAAWAEHGTSVGEGDDLRTWLRTSFFKHHKTVYENRPVYFPLSSCKKSFVAWMSIHRWTAQTLSNLLAEHLHPEKRRLAGELEDLRQARAKGDNGGKGRAEKRFAEVTKLLEELTAFIDHVTECAERGPPQTSPDETKREWDARYEMDLDDGVMVNSAALWPLLEPQWKDPKKWWKELATAKGRKDYDWAHLAKRYFPERVEKKCVEDPSLAVAHGCFWRLHPAKAYAWELRLQDEIRPDFTINEPGSGEARAAFIAGHSEEAKAIRLKEQDRRVRKARKSEGDETLSMALEPAEVEADAEEVE